MIRIYKTTAVSDDSEVSKEDVDVVLAERAIAKKQYFDELACQFSVAWKEKTQETPHLFDKAEKDLTYESATQLLATLTNSPSNCKQKMAKIQILRSIIDLPAIKAINQSLTMINYEIQQEKQLNEAYKTSQFKNKVMCQRAAESVMLTPSLIHWASNDGNFAFQKNEDEENMEESTRLADIVNTTLNELYKTDTKYKYVANVAGMDLNSFLSKMEEIHSEIVMENEDYVGLLDSEREKRNLCLQASQMLSVFSDYGMTCKFISLPFW